MDKRIFFSRGQSIHVRPKPDHPSTISAATPDDPNQPSFSNTAVHLDAIRLEGRGDDACASGPLQSQVPDAHADHAEVWSVLDGMTG